MKRALLPLLLFAAVTLQAAPSAPKWYVAHVIGHPGTIRAKVSVLYGPFRSAKPADALCARAINAAWQCTVESLNLAATFPPAVKP